MLSSCQPLNPALRFRLTGRKGLLQRWKEGGPSRRGSEPGFPVRRPVGSRRAGEARVSLERREGRFPGRTRPLGQSSLAWRWSRNLCEQPEPERTRTQISEWLPS